MLSFSMVRFILLSTSAFHRNLLSRGNEFVSSWAAFDAVLDLLFRDAPGCKKVQNKKYKFQEHSTKRDIARTRPWGASFLPGQKINMSLI